VFMRTVGREVAGTKRHADEGERRTGRIIVGYGNNQQRVYIVAVAHR
jgi:hypothetical protein